MGEFITRIALCLGFFSRLPLPGFLAKRISPDARLSDAVACFPIIGLVVGIIPALVWFLANLAFGSTVAAGLAIGTGLLVTGALHEDGFADCADGLGATPDKEKALEIMRDSRIGTYGALALVISVGLRWAALATFAPYFGMLALLIAHSGSRAAMVLPMRFSQYARSEGLGKAVSGQLPSGSFELTILIATIIALLTGWIAALLALASALVLTFLYVRYLEFRIGGYTGDGLGAVQQIAEISILIVLSGIWA